MAMIGNYLERSPKDKQISRSKLREFIEHIEICLGIRSGTLSILQYGLLLSNLDTIVPFKDGELGEDLSEIDRIVQAYGDKLSC